MVLRARNVVIAAAVFVLVLGGCSSGSSYTAHKSSNSKFEFDSEYVAKVEASASRQGVSVRWINPPVKPAERK